MYATLIPNQPFTVVLKEGFLRQMSSFTIKDDHIFLVRKTCHLSFLKFHFLINSWRSNALTEFAHVAVLIACHIGSTITVYD